MPDPFVCRFAAIADQPASSYAFRIMTPKTYRYILIDLRIDRLSIRVAQKKILNVTAPALEVNRFEHGRMELAFITNFLDVVSNTTETVTVRNSTANGITIGFGVNFELNSSNNTRSAIGTTYHSTTVKPNQTVTIEFDGSRPEVNTFSGGQMFITPLLQ